MEKDSFGTNIHSLKGKTVRKKPQPTRSDFDPLQPEIMFKYRGITVCADVMKVNGV